MEHIYRHIEKRGLVVSRACTQNKLKFFTYEQDITYEILKVDQMTNKYDVPPLKKPIFLPPVFCVYKTIKNKGSSRLVSDVPFIEAINFALRDYLPNSLDFILN